jgi:hypothetical protein
MSYFIRDGAPSDWLPVRDLMRELHDKAPYKDVPIHEEDMKRMFKVACISDRHFNIVIADKKHNVVGICVGVVQMNWWGAKAAIELITYSKVAGWQNKLLSRYSKWAKENGAEMISVVNSAGENERYNQLIEKVGFNKIGSVFMTEVH